MGTRVHRGFLSELGHCRLTFKAPSNPTKTKKNKKTIKKTMIQTKQFTLFRSSDPRPDITLSLFLTPHLEVYAACIFRHSILAYYLASILTSYLASFLASIRTFSLAFFPIFYLASIIYSDTLSGIYSGILSGIFI